MYYNIQRDQCLSFRRALYPSLEHALIYDLPIGRGSEADILCAFWQCKQTHLFLRQRVCVCEIFIYYKKRANKVEKLFEL